LKYRGVYGLDDVLTLYRELFGVGFSKAYVCSTGNDGRRLRDGDSEMSYRQFVNSFLPYHPTDSVEKDTLNFKD
jgi:hypothetical protein